MVENIDRTLQSLSHLFRSLLDISTLDSDKVIPKMEAVSDRCADRGRCVARGAVPGWRLLLCKAEPFAPCRARRLAMRDSLK
ncbi:hypothetical protein ADU59_28760 [Pararhizobium polonicum]|uniref:Uncharacterized protein n=1 Tax=Pararhizobium polonicum TaxID=1612624 RepID=A0A1C7NTL2_9HYPH|nr:hypothetical protein [Pararhizobium polonicum]OBZ92046.1 hypothetical protein ADU59_28760 [Pararhizobium polonicum]